MKIHFIAKSFAKNNPNYKQIQVSWARPPKSTKLSNSKRRSASIASSSITLQNSPINSISNPLITPTPLNMSQTTTDYQMQCYQNSPMALSPMVPIKYDNIDEDKNSLNLFLVWVPIVWVPNNLNKDFAFIENPLF